MTKMFVVVSIHADPTQKLIKCMIVV